MKNLSHIIGAAVAAAVLIGCGKQAAPAPAPAPAPAAAPAAPAAPAAGAKTAKGKEIVVPAKAEMQTYKHEEAKVEIVIPANWDLVKDENYLQVSSPGEELYVEFQVLSASEIEDAVEELTTYLKTKVADAEFQKPKEEKVNGMPAWTVIGTSKEQNMALGASFIQTPANKLLAVYCELTPEAATKYKAEIDQIDAGLKPIN